MSEKSFEEELRDAMKTYKPLSANDFIFKEIVERHYLDKEKVRKAIFKSYQLHFLNDDTLNYNIVLTNYMGTLEKELGL